MITQVVQGEYSELDRYTPVNSLIVQSHLKVDYLINQAMSAYYFSNAISLYFYSLKDPISSTDYCVARVPLTLRYSINRSIANDSRIDSPSVIRHSY